MKKRKKVGIVTLHGYYNYGNRLQNYALQEVIKELGFDVETVVIPRKMRLKTETIAQKIKRISKHSLQDIRKKSFQKICEPFSRIVQYLYRHAIMERTTLFKEFTEKHLSEKFYDNTQVALNTISKTYDFLITGSDQVWNPSIAGMENIYFLTFVEPEKRISYAASFGVNSISEDYGKRIRPLLSKMKAISVRESAGAEIVKSLTGKDPIISLDPTLLLNKERWLSIASKAKKTNPKYILTYFLGNVPKEAIQFLNHFTQNLNLDIIHLADLQDKEAYISGPREFIDYINSAEVVLTDSFHGVAFSIIMETPFVVFKREWLEMYSRIQNLLNIFNLQCREYQNIQSSHEVFEMDFTDINSIVSGERNKAFYYLQNVLTDKFT